MGRQFLPVAGPLDDDLVAGVGQAIERTVSQDWVFEEAEPLFHSPVAGDDESGGTVTADVQLVEVSRLLGGELVEAQVVQDEQGGREKGPEGALQGVVDSGLGHGPEEVVGMEESDGRVAQSLRQEGLAHTSGSQAGRFRACWGILKGKRRPAVGGTG